MVLAMDQVGWDLLSNCGKRSQVTRQAALQLAVAGPAVEAQEMGGERHVAADDTENAQDVAPLELIHGEKRTGMVTGDDHVRLIMVAMVWLQ